MRFLSVRIDGAVVTVPAGASLLRAAAVAETPGTAGVYTLYDGGGAVLKIRGVIHLRAALEEELAAGKAASFAYQEDGLYSSRESQLLQQYLADYGRMPGSDDLDDFF